MNPKRSLFTTGKWGTRKQTEKEKVAETRSGTPRNLLVEDPLKGLCKSLKPLSPEVQGLISKEGGIVDPSE